MLTLIRILFDLLVQFLALVFGCVPLLRSLIFTEHSFFYFLFDSLNILGLVINYVFILFSYSREHGGVLLWDGTKIDLLLVMFLQRRDSSMYHACAGWQLVGGYFHLTP
jgi:hypothetical protein